MTYKITIRSCFVGYIVQAIVNNFVPLLLLTFQAEYGLTLGQAATLVSFNFAFQLLTDLAAAKYIDRIGYRAGMVLAHFFSAAGLAGLAVLPLLMNNAYTGILISVIIYAVGGGLLEVLVSPVVEACPTDSKEKTMSLLHSFYCWGHVGVVMLSTLFFAVFGIENWKLLTIVWAAVPLVNGILFTRVPIAPLLDEDETSMTIGELFRSRMFWILLLLMLCAGASEQSVSQWASAFAEQGLGVGKTIGDLAGPMLFAVMMGISRLVYGKYGDRIDLMKFICFSGVLCVAAYLTTSLLGIPVLGFAGCAVCGFSVGIFWPGVFSLAASGMKKGGTAMFALLALAGDAGCSSGPALVGIVTDAAGGSLSAGILAAIIFPLLFLAGVLLYRRAASRDT